LLIDRGVKVDNRDDMGDTPLGYAVACNSLPITNILRKALSGPSLGHADREFNTAMNAYSSLRYADAYSHFLNAYRLSAQNPRSHTHVLSAYQLGYFHFTRKIIKGGVEK